MALLASLARRRRPAEAGTDGGGLREMRRSGAELRERPTGGAEADLDPASG
jgi:hypothetical protein